MDQAVTTLYLRRIEISNFRAYGDNFSLALPGPGVTILTGPDGAGKSTFFEAIEWALTGRVRRLELLTQGVLDRGKHHGLLARRVGDVPVAQYRVSLEFVNSEAESHRIERSAGREQESRDRFAEISAPSQQQLMDALGAENTQAFTAKAMTERVIAIAAALKAIAGVELSLEGAPPPGVLLDRLAQTFKKGATVLMERQQALSEAAIPLILRLMGVRQKVAEGMMQKSLLVGQNDRHTHELWMLQSYVRDTTKNIQRITELDNQIRGLLLTKQEIERCQQSDADQSRQEAIQSSPILTGVAREQIPAHLAELSRKTQLELESAYSTRDQLPDLEGLTDRQAGMKARIEELSATIKETHEIVARAEQELLVEQAVLQKHPELLSALGTLSADEARALDAARGAVEQLGPHERQLIQKALSNQRNTLAEQESKLQELRAQHERLAEAWLAWEREGEESPPSVDAVEERLRASLAKGGVSMSTAYPRSRWPALLLDEPLQPHGPIHPAAFVEVVRELVRERKYQVILATRDKALAEGMRRKMVAAGIDCVTCRYGGLSPTGVLYSTV
ncbi:AAA family ATPase [Hyalangium minutum]|nr:AAA family ATPase [Hyalangium minutum]